MNSELVRTKITNCTTSPEVPPSEPVGGLDVTSSLPLANLYDFGQFVSITLDICWFLLFLALFTEFSKLLRALRYLASKMANSLEIEDLEDV